MGRATHAEEPGQPVEDDDSDLKEIARMRTDLSHVQQVRWFEHAVLDGGISGFVSSSIDKSFASEVDTALIVGSTDESSNATYPVAHLVRLLFFVVKV